MNSLKINTCIQIFFVLISLSISAKAQNIFGLTGLLTIPTAEINNDKEFSIGIVYQDGKDLDSFFGGSSIYGGFLSITYLPFLELSFRVIQKIDKPTIEGIGDRCFSLKLRILKENSYTPSLSVGATDLFWAFGTKKAIHFNSFFMVASKTINNPFLEKQKTSIHIGYGSDILAAATHQFVGIFGGISLDFNTSQFLNSRISLMAEYDAERFNSGIRLSLFNHINILVGLMGMDSFSGGMSVSWEL